MKKLFFISFLAISSVLTGLDSQASQAAQKNVNDDPCFSSSERWQYCSASDMYIAGYPQENGLYYYYTWQCASFSCPL